MKPYNAPRKKMTARIQCQTFQPPGTTVASPTSLIPESRNTTPSSNPTVAIEVALRRSTIQAISSHRIPETRNTHQ
jgi:hypothetical protein